MRRKINLLPAILIVRAPRCGSPAPSVAPTPLRPSVRQRASGLAALRPARMERPARRRIREQREQVPLVERLEPLALLARRRPRSSRGARARTRGGKGQDLAAIRVVVEVGRRG